MPLCTTRCCWDGREETYMKIAGRNEVVYQAAGIAALVIGGWLGNTQYEFAYYAAIVLGLGALLVDTLMKELHIGEHAPRAGIWAC